MAILIVLLLIAVGYTSHTTAGIAGRVTSVVKDVCTVAYLAMAFWAFKPMAILIVLLLVVMC